MATMVRKQIYIEPEQEAQLKRVSAEAGIAEAEIVRQAINHYIHQARQTPRNLNAWKEQREFIQRWMELGPVEGGRTWRREDLYD